MRKFFLMLTVAMFVLTTSLYATEKSEKKLSVKPFSVINVVGSLKVERRTNEQIAAILGISKDSVATMLSSARRKLFNQIKERNRT